MGPNLAQHQIQSSVPDLCEPISIVVSQIDKLLTNRESCKINFDV